jgi:hypothetical protein
MERCRLRGISGAERSERGLAAQGGVVLGGQCSAAAWSRGVGSSIWTWEREQQPRWGLEKYLALGIACIRMRQVDDGTVMVLVRTESSRSEQRLRQTRWGRRALSGRGGRAARRSGTAIVRTQTCTVKTVRLWSEWHALARSLGSVVIGNLTGWASHSD